MVNPWKHYILSEQLTVNILGEEEDLLVERSARLQYFFIQVGIKHEVKRSSSKSFGTQSFIMVRILASSI